MKLLRSEIRILFCIKYNVILIFYRPFNRFKHSKTKVQDLNNNRLFNIVYCRFYSLSLTLYTESNFSQHLSFLHLQYINSIRRSSSRIFVTSAVVLVMLWRGNKNYEIYYENLPHFHFILRLPFFLRAPSVVQTTTNTII